MAHMTGSDQTGRDVSGRKSTCPICHGSGKVEGAYCACPAGSRIQSEEMQAGEPREGE